MWDIIKYMFYCLSMLVSASIGSNPDGMTWEIGLIGFGTLILIILLVALLFYVVLQVINLFIKTKQKKSTDENQSS